MNLINELVNGLKNKNNNFHFTALPWNVRSVIAELCTLIDRRDVVQPEPIEIDYISPYPLKQAKHADAGYDISSNETKPVYAQTSAIFSTGLYMAIPEGYVGKVVSRSGLSFTHNIEVGAGLIDSGYRGEIRIHLYNHGTNKYTVNKGDRIAQIILLKHETPEFTLVDSLDETERGINGFGHTGVAVEEAV